jgi:transcriptional regulator with XRE-family HTH domain
LLLGLTLKQVSEAAECSESLLSKVENGRAYPSLQTLYRIAVSLGTNVAACLPRAVMHPRLCSTPKRVLRRRWTSMGSGSSGLFPYKDGNLLENTIHMVAPGAGIEPISHQGEELCYVLKGGDRTDRRWQDLPGPGRSIVSFSLRAGP